MYVALRRDTGAVNISASSFIIVTSRHRLAGYSHQLSVQCLCQCIHACAIRVKIKSDYVGFGSISVTRLFILYELRNYFNAPCLTVKKKFLKINRIV